MVAAILSHNMELQIKLMLYIVIPFVGYVKDVVKLPKQSVLFANMCMFGVSSLFYFL